MTNEQAIYVLKNTAWLGTDHSRARTEEAVDMAIKALSQEPICDRDCEHCTWTECPIEPCDDTVSRQAALNSLIDNTHLDGYDLAEALDAIENKEKLPSVTHKSGKWVTDEYGNVICSECKRFRRDCRYGHTNYCNHCGARMFEP